MLDNVNIMKVGGNSININAVSGTLIKSTEKSKIVRFHQNSAMAEYFFDEEQPRRIRDKYEADKYNKNIVVIQVMLCGDSNFLVEYLDIKEKQ